MINLLSRAAVLACALGVVVPAQNQGPGSEALLRLQAGQFDPLAVALPVPQTLQANAGSRLWIVQFEGLPTQQGRDAIVQAGGEVHGYLPSNAYVVRMDPAAVDAVRGLAVVRWVGAYHPYYRLDRGLVAELQAASADQQIPARRYHIVVVDKRRDKPALARKIQALGGIIDDEQQGSLLFTVTLTGPQLLAAAQLDEVLWIDRWSAPENDMDNARIQGGGNYVETQGGFTGTGVRVHIYEGIEATHPDFTGGAINVHSGGGADDHGHATAGIVFGNGTSNPAVRGMAPDCTKYYTQYSTNSTSRWQTVSDLVNIHEVMHTTASWGGARVRTYTSVSADSDDIVFDHDIPWTQSQSNAGNQDSRPEAWAKNVISIGGVQHFDNSNPLDDSWAAGGGSTGPAADGAIKPILAAYYDSIGTSDRTGAAGYSAGNWSAGFGGTSGATPIVAGHNVLALQMFTDGIFGNTLRNPNGSRFSNRPHFTTLRGLQIVSASQYAFTASSTNNRREHVGWGFPDLRKMWDNRNKTFLVDETDVLTQGQATRWLITVLPGESALTICMNHNDPAANPAAAQTLINNLSLRVTSPSGTVYWGNNGLQQGNWSVAGGAEDSINPIECVMVQNPQAGVWLVDVKATLIAMDSHVETPQVDADYALAVSGGTGVRGNPPVFASFAPFGQGCPGSVALPSNCTDLNPNGGTQTNNLRTYEYAYRVLNSGTMHVAGFDFFTRSTGGTVTVNAHLYASNGTAPTGPALATTTLTVGPNPAFYTATFPGVTAMTGNFFISVNTSAQTVYLSHLSAGATGVAYYRTPPSGNWLQSGLVTRPSYRIICAGSGGFATPEQGNIGLPTLNTTYTVTLGSAVPSSVAAATMGFSDQSYNGTPLPYALPGAPGCNLLVSPEGLRFIPTSVVGTATTTVSVPNASNLIGVTLHHQWLVLDNVNTLGLVVSNAGRATVGN